MNKKITITESERIRILNSHRLEIEKSHLKYLSEQTGTALDKYKLPTGNITAPQQPTVQQPTVQQPTSSDVWLTYPNDKNYQYQKQNGKWVAKIIKTGKIVDLSKYPTTIAKLDKQFPDGGGTVPNDNTVGTLTPKPAGTVSAISNDNTVGTLTPKPAGTVSNVVTPGGVTTPVTAPNPGTSPTNNSTVTSTQTASTPGGAGFVLKPGMKGIGEYQDNAEGKTYVVNKVTHLKCDLIEVEFKNKGGRLEYGYYEPSMYKTNSITFRRNGEGMKSANACAEFNTFGDFGNLTFG